MSATHRFQVAPEEEGRRLDVLLAAKVPGLSRRRARVLLDIGGVFVGGRRSKIAGRFMRAGEEVEAVLGGALGRAKSGTGKKAREKDASALPAFRIVYEDDAIVVVDKPAGLLAAATPESDRTNIADLLSRRATGKVFVVHRIDLETSGLLVYAKDVVANRVLSERFAAHDLDREYAAVVKGSVPDDLVKIEAPLSGKKAITHLAVGERFGEKATSLRVMLETGRTHQIRRHLAAKGFPVLGDPLHKTRGELGAPRVALHARVLAIPHPVTKAALRFESPLPKDLTDWMARLRRPQAEG